MSLLNVYKKYKDKGYYVATYYNQYGYDYDILVKVDDIYKYLINKYPKKFVEHIHQKCLKNTNYLWGVGNILEKNDTEDWKDLKRYIFNEGGAIFYD